MTLDSYLLGQEESFCAWVEYKTEDLGNISDFPKLREVLRDMFLDDIKTAKELNYNCNCVKYKERMEETFKTIEEAFLDNVNFN